MVNVSSPGWDTVIVSKRNRNEYDSPQSTRRTQSFNLLFIKMFKRKIFSVSSVSSVVNKTQKQMNKESSVLLSLCLKKNSVSSVLLCGESNLKTKFV